MESSSRVERDDFLKRLKDEWGRLWRERFDDKVRAEGVSSRDYPMVFMDRGHVIFATRAARAPSFSEVMQSYASQGLVYSPEPNVGGWGKFIQKELRRAVHSRARSYVDGESERKKAKQQLKKGGRGWLHR